MDPWATAAAAGDGASSGFSDNATTDSFDSSDTDRRLHDDDEHSAKCL